MASDPRLDTDPFLVRQVAYYRELGCSDAKAREIVSDAYLDEETQ